MSNTEKAFKVMRIRERRAAAHKRMLGRKLEKITKYYYRAEYSEMNDYFKKLYIKFYNRWHSHVAELRESNPGVSTIPCINYVRAQIKISLIDYTWKIWNSPL